VLPVVGGADGAVRRDGDRNRRPPRPVQGAMWPAARAAADGRIPSRRTFTGPATTSERSATGPDVTRRWRDRPARRPSRRASRRRRRGSTGTEVGARHAVVRARRRQLLRPRLAGRRPSARRVRPSQQAISELFELGAPWSSRGLLVVGLGLSGVAFLLLAPVLDRRLPGEGRLGPVLVAVAGIGTLGVIAAPCSPGCPGADTTPFDLWHTVAAGVGYGALVLAPLAFAWRLRSASGARGLVRRDRGRRGGAVPRLPRRACSTPPPGWPSGSSTPSRTRGTC
jgi:hypothetical protein